MAERGDYTDDKWVSVPTTILGRTIAAIRGRVDNRMVWLPRSCLHDEGTSADEALLHGGFMPLVDLKVARWKAQEIGAI